jgi:hypothetical protein
MNQIAEGSLALLLRQGDEKLKLQARVGQFVQPKKQLAKLSPHQQLLRPKRHVFFEMDCSLLVIPLVKQCGRLDEMDVSRIA